MDDTHHGYVFFSDYSWYDGEVYVENGEAINGKNVNPEYLTEMNARIHRLVQKNDWTQKYDYFRNLK